MFERKKPSGKLLSLPIDQIHPSPFQARKSIANFIIVELLRRVNLGEVSMDALPFSAEEFAELVKMADTEQVSKNDAKKILRQMIETGKNAKTIAEESGMLIVNDTKKAEEIIVKILAENPEAVSQYQNGEKKVFGFLMGQSPFVYQMLTTIWANFM